MYCITMAEIVREWRTLPDEILLHIMSYWRPRNELTYLEQLKTVNLIKSFKIPLNFDLVNNHVTFRKFYINSDEFRTYMHYQLSIHDMSRKISFDTQRASIKKGTREGGLPANLFWHEMKHTRVKKIVDNIYRVCCEMLYTSRRHIRRDFADMVYRNESSAAIVYEYTGMYPLS